MTESEQERGDDQGLARRGLAERLLEAHGVAVHCYCVAMLGREGAIDLLPTVFGHVEEHLTERTSSADEPLAQLTVYAVAHNRCIERSRTGGKPPRGEDLEGDEALVVRALAELRPVGRGVLLLRSVLGLGWEELERVCGMPRSRLLNRVCRAWRRVGQLVDGETDGVRPDGVRPKVVSKDKTTDGVRPKVVSQGWAAIRADAQHYASLRNAVRKAYADPPPEGWRADVWQRLDQERADADARQRAEQRAADRKTAQEHAKSESVKSESVVSAVPTTILSEAQPSPSAHSPCPKVVWWRKRIVWRGVVLGALLAVITLTTHCLLTR